MTEKLAHIIKKATFALLYIVIYFAFLYLLSIEVIRLGEDLENYNGVVTTLASLAALSVYGITFYLRSIKIKHYIYSKSVTLIDVVLSFTMAIGFRLLTGAYLMWAENNVPVLQKSIENAQQSYNFNTMTDMGLITIVFSICIVAPFFEEVLFRGIVQKEFCDIMPTPLAIIIQGLLFGLAHAVLAQSIFAGIYGIILGIIYYKTKNIFIAIFSHMFFNLSSVLEVRNPDMLGQMIATGLGLTVASISIFFYMYRRKHSSDKEEVTGGNDNV